MAEWLGNGLQNRVQQFDSAWYLKPTTNPFRNLSGRGFLLNLFPIFTPIKSFKSKTKDENHF